MIDEDSSDAPPSENDVSVDKQNQSSSEPRQYDFSTQERVVRGRMPTLETINERFIRTLRSTIHHFIRSEVQIFFTGIQIRKNSDYLHSLAVPSAINIVKMEPLRGVSIIVFEPQMIYNMVEIFFGGEGRTSVTRPEGREFTPSEDRINSILLDACMQHIEESWRSIKPLKLSKVGFESNPSMVDILSPSEALIVSTFKVSLEIGSGEIHVSIPYSAIEPIRELLDTGVSQERTGNDRRWMNSLREEILDAPVKISSVLAERKMSLGTLKNLKEGDVFEVDVPDQLELRANGMPVFLCKLGEHDGRIALQVTEKFKE